MNVLPSLVSKQTPYFLTWQSSAPYRFWSLSDIVAYRWVSFLADWYLHCCNQYNKANNNMHTWDEKCFLHVAHNVNLCNSHSVVITIDYYKDNYYILYTKPKKEPSLCATYRTFALKMKMVYSRRQCKCTLTFSFYHKMFTSNFGIAFGTQ